MKKLGVRLVDFSFGLIVVTMMSILLPKRRDQTPRERLEAWMKAKAPDWPRLWWQLGGSRALFALAFDLAEEHKASCEHCRQRFWPYHTPTVVRQLSRARRRR